MSKVGRKSIDITDVQVEVKGQDIHYKGKLSFGVYTLPESLKAIVADKKLTISVVESFVSDRSTNRVWGLHRSLISNGIEGSRKGFVRNLEINGLGFKAVVSGKNVVFTLGYSHKINFELPDNVTMEVDRSGQKLMLKSPDKELVGHVSSMIRALRSPEPYKGTGIKFVEEVIRRKAGKTKAA